MKQRMHIVWCLQTSNFLKSVVVFNYSPSVSFIFSSWLEFDLALDRSEDFCCLFSSKFFSFIFSCHMTLSDELECLWLSFEECHWRNISRLLLWLGWQINSNNTLVQILVPLQSLINTIIWILKLSQVNKTMYDLYFLIIHWVKTR